MVLYLGLLAAAAILFVKRGFSVREPFRNKPYGLCIGWLSYLNPQFMNLGTKLRGTWALTY